MRILAIDPGSSLGWATDSTGRLEFGTEDFHVKNGESSGNRWRRFGEWLYDCTLLPHTTTKPAVDLIVYEKAMFHPKSRLAAEIAAGFTTRLEEHCERHGIALQPVAVQTLKAFALPKVKRKKGDPLMDRSKAAMIRAAWNRLDYTRDRMRACESLNKPTQEPDGQPITPITLTGVYGNFAEVNEHEADALWLYFYAKEVVLANR